MTTLPLAELHMHIEGSLEPLQIFELAERNGIALPYSDIGELAALYEFTDLQSFLDLYYANMSVLRTAEDFADLARAYFRRAAAGGVTRAEIFFDPQAHTSRGGRWGPSSRGWPMRVPGVSVSSVCRAG